MIDYNPDSFASIMRAIYDEQVVRYESSGINPHPRTHQEQVKLRAKINTAYAQANDDTSIANIAEGILFTLRDGHHMQHVMELSNQKLLEMARDRANNE